MNLESRTHLQSHAWTLLSSLRLVELGCPAQSRLLSVDGTELCFGFKQNSVLGKGSEIKSYSKQQFNTHIHLQKLIS